ncbi:hypothetical protein [Rhizobium laguerreae]|uniref:hypothetical protein n=1 Tax=Rhizobium laguerreae TaxID=1076926 RepID=UPI001C92097C|nr:hypothetical protein [Rhizobium laguerreae]MBY3167389.1 hypothetical protein [Rhizobium laguerreae]
MTISTKTAKMLWGKAAARCSMRGCRKLLVIDETETDDPALIGDMAHMVAESEDGPRGVSPLTQEERNRYANLILLCKNHHREIDEQPGEWPVDRLQSIKAQHEEWVVGFAPGYDAQKVRDDIIYAGYVDDWERLAHIDTWTEWSSWILSHGQPSIDRYVRDDLAELVRWTIKRIWPQRYPRLEEAMKNFATVLADFLKTFNQHCEPSGLDEDELWTRKFYKIPEWDDERYHRLLAQYDFHVDLVEDLMLELTRAANFICDEVRGNLLHTYRLKEGRLSVRSGPHEDLTWRESVVEYRPQERAIPRPYPGLESFLTGRADRDRHFGTGTEPG